MLTTTTRTHDTQFTLVFWDIIFADVNGVFETAYQTAPLDLSSDAFAIGPFFSLSPCPPSHSLTLSLTHSLAVRRPMITARLTEIESGQASSFLIEADDREREKGTFAVGVRWERFSKEELVEIVQVRVLFFFFFLCVRKKG